MPNLIFKSAAQLLSFRSQLSDGAKVGVVPTMGNLHQGHISLVSQSLLQNDFTIVTIFINPKQFGPGEDFGSYPRTLDEDVALLNNLGSESIVIFAPDSTSEIYPKGFTTTIEVEGPMTQVLCGAKRPGHFAGVTTVVYQLFALTGAHRAYFGLKDYQQLQVIKRMVHDLRLQVEIISMPIKRDPSGLALSSRNQYLSFAEREEALLVSKILKELRELWQNSGAAAARELQREVLERDSRWDYLEILDGDSLAPVSSESKVILFAAARFFGKARLIDNMTLELEVAR